MILGRAGRLCGVFSALCSLISGTVVSIVRCRLRWVTVVLARGRCDVTVRLSVPECVMLSLALCLVLCCNLSRCRDLCRPLIRWCRMMRCVRLVWSEKQVRVILVVIVMCVVVRLSVVVVLLVCVCWCVRWVLLNMLTLYRVLKFMC